MWYRFEMYRHGNVWEVVMVYADSDYEAWWKAGEYAERNGYEDYCRK